MSTVSSLSASGAISGAASVILVLSSVPPSSPATFVLISYGSVLAGTSAAVSVLANFTSGCAVVAPVAATTLGPTSLTATVTVTSCGSQLSPGAIAGIAIGAVAVGVLIGVAVFLGVRYQRRRVRQTVTEASVRNLVA
jgi:hypothetical protein